MQLIAKFLNSAMMILVMFHETLSLSWNVVLKLQGCNAILFLAAVYLDGNSVQ